MFFSDLRAADWHLKVPAGAPTRSCDLSLFGFCFPENQRWVLAGGSTFQWGTSSFQVFSLLAPGAWAETWLRWEERVHPEVASRLLAPHLSPPPCRLCGIDSAPSGSPWLELKLSSLPGVQLFIFCGCFFTLKRCLIIRRWRRSADSSSSCAPSVHAATGFHGRPDARRAFVCFCFSVNLL